MKSNLGFDRLGVVSEPAARQSDALLTTPQLRARLGYRDQFPEAHPYQAP
jgi:hypothetical protein